MRRDGKQRASRAVSLLRMVTLRANPSAYLYVLFFFKLLVSSSVKNQSAKTKRFRL